MKKNYSEKQTRKIVTSLFHNRFDHVRVINIHGNQFQEAGLPDLLVVVDDREAVDNFWFELKRNWKDEPTPLQKYNVANLSSKGFITGFVVGDQFKAVWDDPEPILLEDIM